MNLVEEFRVGKERAETGVGAKQNRPSAILCARIISGIGITKDPPAECDELFVFFLLLRGFGHYLVSGILGEYDVLCEYRVPSRSTA